MTLAALLATVGGVGRLPVAPGTWGSVVGALAGWPILHFGGPAALLAAVVLLTPIAVWSAGRHAADLGHKDPGEIVIDEVVGQWIALLAATPSIPQVVVAFLLFRLFDVTKPWPIRWAERRFGGGIGIVADDAMAGTVAAFLLLLAIKVIE